MSSAGSQFQPKFSVGVVDVPGFSSTGSTFACRTPGWQYSDACSCAALGLSAGPGSWSGAKLARAAAAFTPAHSAAQATNSANVLCQSIPLG